MPAVTTLIAGAGMTVTNTATTNRDVLDTVKVLLRKEEFIHRNDHYKVLLFYRKIFYPSEILGFEVIFVIRIPKHSTSSGLSCWTPPLGPMQGGSQAMPQFLDLLLQECFNITVYLLA